MAGNPYDAFDAPAVNPYDQFDAKAPTSPQAAPAKTAAPTPAPAPSLTPKRDPHPLVSPGVDFVKHDLAAASEVLVDQASAFFGVAEAAAAVPVETGKAIISGFAGIFGLGARKTQSWLNQHVGSVPQNDTARDIGTVLSLPFTATHAGADKTFEKTGSPALATAAEVIPDAAMMLLGMRRGAKTPAGAALEKAKGPPDPVKPANPAPDMKAPEAVAKEMASNAVVPPPQRPLETDQDLDDFLHQQKNLQVADMHNASRLGEAAGKAIDKAQQEELVHHVEKPGTGNVTPDTLDFHARVLRIVSDATDQVAQSLKLRGWGEVDATQAEEGGGVGYVHRTVVGKSPVLDALKEGEEPKGSVTGSFFSRKASAMFRRKMMALEDENGNRTVVHVGPQRVTGFTDKKPADLGAKQLTAVGDLLKQELAPMVKERTRLTREQSILERYQGRQSRASKRLSRVNDAVRDIDDQRALARQTERLDQRIRDLETQRAALEPHAGDTRLTKRIQQIKDDIETTRATHEALVESKRALDPDRWESTLAKWKQDAMARRKGMAGEGKVLRGVQEPNRVARAVAKVDRQIEALRRKRAAVGFMKFDPVEQARLAELHVQKNILEKAAETYNPGRRRLLNIRNRVKDIDAEMAKVHGRYGDQNVASRVFVDKNGKRWRVKDATIKEIEKHTDLQYHKHYTVSLLKNYVELMAKKRMADALDAIKASPLVRDRMVERSAGNAPKDWVTPKVPAFQQYLMDPKLAEILNDYYGEKGELEGMMEKVSKAIISPMFLNPLPHIWNTANHALIEHGFFGTIEKLYPPSGVRYIRGWWDSMKDVFTQSPEYMEAIRNGGSMMYAKTVFANEWNDFLASSMRDSLTQDPTFIRLAKATGRAPIQAYEGMMKMSNRVLWGASDIMMMRAVREKMSKGMGIQEAIRHTETHIPNYRVPSRVMMDNRFGRAMSVAIRNPAVTAFGRYHYGIFRSYANMVHDMIARDVPLKDRAKAADQMLMLGVATFVLYPVLDGFVRKILNNPNARIIRSGASRIPDMVSQVLHGEKNSRSLAMSSMTLSPAMTLPAQVIFNKDLITGNDIRQGNPIEQGKDLLSFGMNQIAPLQWSYQVSTGKKSLGQEVLSQVGIDAPSDEQVDRREKYRAKEERKLERRREREEDDE